MPASSFHPDNVFQIDPKTNSPISTEAAICSYVRQGAYPHVAALACRVPAEVFDAWMERGKKKSSKRYHRFRLAVLQAEAQARIKAEVAVLAQRPESWLKSGPGKEREGAPGWSGVAKPALTSQTQINLLASPEWNSLWATILSALSQFPDAREALLEAVTSSEKGAGPPALTVTHSAARADPGGEGGPGEG